MKNRKLRVHVAEADPSRQSRLNAKPPDVSIYDIWYEGDRANTILRAHTNVRGDFVIDDLDVHEERRRNGIGKQLVRCALAEAEKADAKRITAILISAECISVMKSVFGPESVTVHCEGDFGAEDYDAFAMLNYELGTSDS